MRHPSAHNRILRSALAVALSIGTVVPAATLAHEGDVGTVSVAKNALFSGLLVRTPSDPRVYYLQGDTRRPILSPSAFTGQGFSWDDVHVVDDDELVPFAVGEAIDTPTPLGLVVEKARLPDMAPLAPYDIRFVVSGGRTNLKFTGTFWNRGKGELEIFTEKARTTGDAEYPAKQNLYRPDGSYLSLDVGTLFWHTVHNHYHYDDFGMYKLELVKLAPGAQSGQNVMINQKNTFCLRDDTVIGAPADAPRQPRTYGGCQTGYQGVSVGWADVYPYTLPDQLFDVTDLPAGRYKLSFHVDHTGSFSETNRDNNLATTVIDMDPAKRTVSVVAVASPFPSSSNRYADGLLIRGDHSNDVYVIKNNRRHHIKDEAIFNSYGYDMSDVVVLPQAAVDLIPHVNLVRLSGTGTLYFVNASGFRRRVLSPAVLASYGASPADVLDVNAADFARMPETDMIKRADSDRVFSTVTKSYLGTMRELAEAGKVVSSVHVANQTDFEAYAVEVVGTDFNVPWDIAFLPDGDMLVTERPGVLRRVGKNPLAIDLPGVYDFGEGGLMGIALHPDFASNQLLYMYYTAVDGGKRNRIVRYVFDGFSLTEDRVIIDNIPSAIYHDGGRMAFGPDGMLYVTTGDANKGSNAQDRGSLAGKTLRLTPDGGIPSDNPFGNSPVWSYGHRNSQGLAWDSFGNQWQTEHGRSGVTSGYDELNLIAKGANYGWPTYESTRTAPGITAPVVVTSSTETWAPSGLAYADGSLFFAGLLGKTLYEAVPNAEGKVTAFRKHLVGSYGRLRAVVPGPNGTLYVTTSNRDGRGTAGAGDDKILRVYPAMLH